jgi:hypothetical protein
MCSWLNLFALRYKNGNQKKDMQYNGQEKFEDTKRANQKPYLEELHAIQCPKTKGQSEAVSRRIACNAMSKDKGPIRSRI